LIGASLNALTSWMFCLAAAGDFSRTDRRFTPAGQAVWRMAQTALPNSI